MEPAAPGRTVGIRREDKNEWERRTPLLPSDAALLQKMHGFRFLVQPSLIRVFRDEDYRAAGCEVSEDLSPAALVLAIKEIPIHLLQPGKTYVFFAHVIKGQHHNMPMLRRLCELGCSLVDYERIVDEQNRRLVFFGRQAGHAGMIETLWCLGSRLRAGGVRSPLEDVRHAHAYESLEAAKAHLKEVGERILREGPPLAPLPLVFGLAGYGNVSQGAQEVLDCLPVKEIRVEDLHAAAGPGGPPLLKVVFKEEHMAAPTEPDGPFSLSEYYQHPDLYSGIFDHHLPHLDVLVNCIYWDERYPRLVTREWVQRHYQPGLRPRLQVIGDISCDIEGSIEVTLKATKPDAPCYVYDPEKHTIREGFTGPGPAIMAVDNLPCELPRESSESFSRALVGMVPDLAAADWGVDLSKLALPPHLKRAVIVHRGELTPPYLDLRRHMEA